MNYDKEIKFKVKRTKINDDLLLLYYCLFVPVTYNFMFISLWKYNPLLLLLLYMECKVNTLVELVTIYFQKLNTDIHLRTYTFPS